MELLDGQGLFRSLARLTGRIMLSNVPAHHQAFQLPLGHILGFHIGNAATVLEHRDIISQENTSLRWWEIKPMAIPRP